MSIFMVIFYVPLYLQVLGYNTADAGLRLIGTPVGIAISSVAGGYIMKKTGKYVGLVEAVFLL